MWNCIPRLLCAVALLTCASLAHAQIYHCIGAHGEPVFSGEPCGTPAPSGHGATASSGVGAVCAASAQSLRTAVAGAFQTHDVNLLAGLIVWRGIGQSSARATLRSLANWLQQPLEGISIAYSGADPPPPEAAPVYADAPDDTPGNASVVTQAPTGLAISTGGVAGSTRYFGLTESEGCWWLTF